jgi:lysophospholipase II
MPGWFDLYDWPIDVGCTDDREQKLRAVRDMKNIIKASVQEGIERVVIGGFSQGGAIALLTAFYPEEPIPELKGCVSLSGWLTLLDDLKPFDNTMAKVSLFWGHGQYDDKVLFEQQAHGVAKLRELGLNYIEDYQYPIGHSSDQKELQHMAAYLDRVFFGADKADEL